MRAAMDIDNLVNMANRIGEFFAAMPDAAEARAGVATHIRRFWEPRMRAEILAHLDGGGAGLSALVADALKAHRTEF